jgi:hypothetical protein
VPPLVLDVESLQASLVSSDLIDMFPLTSTVTLLVVGALLSTTVVAAPAPEYVTKLSDGEVSAFIPFLHFAGATYCPSNRLEGWSCGST